MVVYHRVFCNIHDLTRDKAHPQANLLTNLVSMINAQWVGNRDYLIESWQGAVIIR